MTRRLAAQEAANASALVGATRELRRMRCGASPLQEDAAGFVAVL